MVPGTVSVAIYHVFTWLTVIIDSEPFMRYSDSHLLPEESFYPEARGGGCEEDGMCPPPFGEMWEGPSYMQERKECVSVGQARVPACVQAVPLLP